MDNAKKIYNYVYAKFFGRYLSLRTNVEIKENIVKLPDINKHYLTNLKKYYQI